MFVSKTDIQKMHFDMITQMLCRAELTHLVSHNIAMASDAPDVPHGHIVHSVHCRAVSSEKSGLGSAWIICVEEHM